MGICEDVLVKVGKFKFPVDFVILEMEKDDIVPIILGRLFLATVRAVIDVHDGKLTLRVGIESLKTSRIRWIYLLHQKTDYTSLERSMNSLINVLMNKLKPVGCETIISYQSTKSRKKQRLSTWFLSILEKNPLNHSSSVT